MSEDRSLYISTVQAAEALGVSVSTVKRWVDDGILPAHRTAGGHRKLLRAEVLALARQSDLPRQDLTRLSVPSGEEEGEAYDEVTKGLLSAALRGDATEVRSLVERLYRAGTPVADLADNVIAPVMHQIGHDWETHHIDVWQEHRGTQAFVASLYDLKAELEVRAERGRPLAIGATPEGDPYLLATLLAQMILLDAGWQAVNLGPNTPFASLQKAVVEMKPRLVWLSVTHLEDKKRFLREYADFYKAAEQANAAVAIGGQALSQELRAVLPYTTFGDRLGHLAAFAQTLHSRRRRPRRGRPRRSSHETS